MTDISKIHTFVNCRHLRQYKASALFKHVALISGKRTVSRPTRQQLFVAWYPVRISVYYCDWLLVCTVFAYPCQPCRYSRSRSVFTQRYNHHLQHWNSVVLISISEKVRLRRQQPARPVRVGLVLRPLAAWRAPRAADPTWPPGCRTCARQKLSANLAPLEAWER